MALILVLATLDTKGEEAAFVAECIARHGDEAWVVDVGIAGVPDFQGRVSRNDVASAAGSSRQAMRSLTRTQAMEVVARGAAAVVAGMVSTGKAQAIIGIGGGTGTWLASTIMHALPLGFPKLIVSTIGAADSSTDIMVMPSVADIAGLNKILRPILANAAAAVCGMAHRKPIAPDQVERPLVALTMFGVTTPGGTLVRRFLEQGGCEVVAFHANGSGGATMEALIARGEFEAVVDWTTREVTDELTGGICSAGAGRLDAASVRGIPQVIVPGAVDVINVRGDVPARFQGRAVHMHLPTVPLIRTSAEESAEIANWIANKINRSTGPVRVLIPEGGYSMLDVKGGVFEDKQANHAFVTALKQSLRPDIPIELLPFNINEEPFAKATAEAMLAMLGDRRSHAPGSFHQPPRLQP